MNLLSLQEFPAVNAEIREENIIYKNHFDIGIAVGTEKGLVVPVLKDADTMTFGDIEKNIVELSTKAKEGSLTMDDLTGGTFTISNGGVYGSMLSTPIINRPQSGILGMHNIQKRAVVVDDYGFSDNDLDREIFVDGSLGLETATLKEIIKILNQTYSSSIGVEFLHIQSVEQKQWVQERIEEVHNKTNFTTQGKKAIYQRLVESELFEQYLDKKFLGTKRYGVEGGESMIPGIEQIVKQSCLADVQDIYFGTAHRGRLTLLATVLGMPYKGILSKFRVLVWLVFLIVHD